MTPLSTAAVFLGLVLILGGVKGYRSYRQQQRWKDIRKELRAGERRVTPRTAVPQSPARGC